MKISHSTKYYFISVLFILCACESSTIKGSAKTDSNIENQTSGQTTKPTAFAGGSFFIYNPCPGEKCTKHEEVIPPEDQWCATGYRLCSKKKASQ